MFLVLGAKGFTEGFAVPNHSRNSFEASNISIAFWLKRVVALAAQLSVGAVALAVSRTAALSAGAMATSVLAVVHVVLLTAEWYGFLFFI